MQRTCKVEGVYRMDSYDHSTWEWHDDYATSCGGTFSWYEVDAPRFCPWCGGELVDGEVDDE